MDTKRILQLIGNMAEHAKILTEQPEAALRQPEVQKALAELFGKDSGAVVKLNAVVSDSLLIDKTPAFIILTDNAIEPAPVAVREATEKLERSINKIV